jgi:hypothetical protein
VLDISKEGGSCMAWSGVRTIFGLSVGQWSRECKCATFRHVERCLLKYGHYKGKGWTMTIA